MSTRSALAIAIAVALVPSAAPANAAQGDVATCQFQGLSGFLIPEMQDVEPDLNEDVVSGGGPDIELGTYWTAPVSVDTFD